MSGAVRSAALVVVIGVALACALARPADAHLMVAQHGTLNLVGDGGFLVLSVPVDAFAGVDDDGDGALTMRELRAHAGAIEAQVAAHVILRADGVPLPLPLEGVMLSLSPPGQVIVMGRFALGEHSDGGRGLALSVSLFGRTAAEQSIEIVVTRGREHGSDGDAQLVALSPADPERALFPGAWRSLVDAGALGFHHVASGFDHLLFLLVVVVAGWRPRQLIGVLSCFTLGHAITLGASLWVGARLPAGIVEPAIAATIVGMALFDAMTAPAMTAGPSRAPRPPPRGRLALVFGCALIHGLGLAGALTGLGLAGTSRGLVLLGFNAGVELAQLALALAAVCALAALRALGGPLAVRRATQLAWLLAIIAGSAWFVERVAQALG